MTRLREQIETSLGPDAAFAYVADFANSMQWDPGVATSRADRRGPVGVGARYRLGVRLGGRVALMEYRISTFEPSAPRRPRRRRLRVSAVDDIRFAPDGTGTRDPLHRRHPPGRPAAARPAVPGPARSRSSLEAPPTACSGRSMRAQQAGRRHGAGLPRRTRHEGRHRRLRDQRADRRLRAAPGPRGPAVRGASRCRRACQDGRRPAPTGPLRRRHRLHRLQRATYPRFVGLLAELGVETQPSDMSLGSACRACGVGVQLAGLPRLSSPRPSLASPPTGGCSPTSLRFYRDARERLDRGGATRRDPGRLPRRSRATAARSATHFLVPDHLRGLVDRAGPHPRLPGRLPAPLPRQPRPDRPGQRAPVADGPGGSTEYVQRIVARLPAGAVRAGDPVVSVRA